VNKLPAKPRHWQEQVAQQFAVFFQLVRATAKRQHQTFTHDWHVVPFAVPHHARYHSALEEHCRCSPAPLFAATAQSRF
jgi:hypothetical protein